MTDLKTPVRTLLEEAIEKTRSALFLNNFDEVISLTNRIIPQVPDNADAYFLRGAAFYGMKKVPMAITCFERVLQINENYQPAIVNLAGCYKLVGKYEEAVLLCKNALKSFKNDPEIYNIIATIYAAQQRYDMAERYFQKSIRYSDKYASPHYNMGIMYLDRMLAEKAIPCFIRSFEMSGSFNSAINAAIAYMMAGKNAEAEQYIKKAIEIKPDSIRSYCTYADVKKHQNIEDSMAAKMEELLQNKSIDKEDACRLLFALGKIYDDCKLYDKAFSYYDRANNIKLNNFIPHKKPDIRIEKFEKELSWLSENINKDYFKERTDYGVLGQSPLFIAGTPRSGTTLVEQIISRHPDVIAGGELNYITLIIEKYGISKNEAYPLFLNSLAAPDAKDMANQYLKMLHDRCGKTQKMIANKAIINFQIIGLLYLMFPDAKVINCRRHPLDSCLSMYFQNFRSGNVFTFNLKNLADYYKQYCRIYKYWKGIFGDRMYDVCYENLVADQSEISSEMFAHCGLQWKDEYSDFYNNKSSVATASIWQVRQPVYQTSRYRWKNYDEHIGVLKETLAEEIAEYEAGL